MKTKNRQPAYPGEIAKDALEKGSQMFDWFEFDESVRKGFEEQAEQLNVYIERVIETNMDISRHHSGGEDIEPFNGSIYILHKTAQSSFKHNYLSLAGTINDGCSTTQTDNIVGRRMPRHAICR